MAYGCASHAVSLLDHDAILTGSFSPALRAAVTVDIFFTGCVRARSTLSNIRLEERAAGMRVGGLRSFSRTRWVGDSLTIPSVLEILPSIRRALFSVKAH